MKRMRLICAVLLICLLVAGVCAVPAWGASDGETLVYDRAGFLTDEEIASLTARARQAEEETGTRFLIATTGSMLWGQDLMSEIGRSQSESTVILIVTRGSWDDEYYYDLYTYGKADRKIKDSEANAMLDAVYADIKGGRLAAGLTMYLDMMQDALAFNWTAGILLGLIAGVCTGGICVGVVVFRYRSKVRSQIYPLDRYARLDLTERSDSFQGSFVSKTALPRSTGGSGRSGGGRTGGRGGGGGHRGGR